MIQAFASHGPAKAEELAKASLSGPALNPAAAPQTPATEGELLTSESPVFRWDGTLTFEAAGYLYSPRTKTEDVYPTLIGRPEAYYRDGIFEATGKLEGVLETPFSKQDNTNAYLELPQGYLSLILGSNNSKSGPDTIQIAFGRKLEEWNHLDEEWLLGIWQPRYRWDYLRPDTVALTGLTVEVERPLFKGVVLLSPVFIPERGVNISNDNGQLISDSPWFISPPNNIQVMTRDTPLKYDLQIPSMKKILLHPSASAMIRIGDKMGPWLLGGYAYKPMNQLLLSYDGKLIINDNRSAVDVASVPVVPHVGYHHLISAEAGFNHEVVTGWLSALVDRPGHDFGQGISGTWTEQTVTKSWALSPTVQFHIQDEKENRMKAEFSYLYQEGGNGPDLTADGKPILVGQSVFESRYPFQSALKVGGDIEMPGILAIVGLHNAGIVDVASSLLYDTKNRGSVFTFDLRYLPTIRWEVDLGADILGSDETSANPGDSGPSDFIGRYQANDRIRAGVKYVF